MAINNNQRDQIQALVTNPPANFNNLILLTTAGPCADWVGGVIEHATKQKISNLSNVFASNIDYLNRGKLIPDFQTFQNHVQNGDILYVVDKETGNTTHYMLKCNIQFNGTTYSCLGVNGGYFLNSVPYHGVIASIINGQSFGDDGSFIYDRQNNQGRHHLFCIDYDLRQKV